MNSFDFNNKNSLEDMNLGIVGNPTRPRPTEIVETETIEGRKSGSLVYKTGAYKDLVVTRKLRLLTFKDYEEETLKIMDWLQNIEDNRLILKDYPQRCYKVKYVEVSDFEDYRGGNVDFEVKFICEPFLYNSSEQEMTLNNGDIIFSDGFINSDPIIKLDLPQTIQTIQVSIGTKTIEIAGVKGDLIIDCIAPRVICEGIEVRSTGNFPIITPGYNIVAWTGTVNKFSIIKNLLYRG